MELIFEKLISHGLIVSKKKLKLFKTQIEFLGLELEDGQIKLQDHIVQKINNFLDKLEDLKTLQSFLGLLNYARPYIKNLSRLARPLYSKTKNTGQRYYNSSNFIWLLLLFFYFCSEPLLIYKNLYLKKID